MNMKAEYDGEQINIYDEDGDLVYEIPIQCIVGHEAVSLTEFASLYGADFLDTDVTDALYNLFDAEEKRIEKHLDYLKNYYNV